MKIYHITVLLFLCLLIGCNEEKAPDKYKGNWIGTMNFEPYPELVSLTIDSSVISKFYYTETNYFMPKDLLMEDDQLSFLIDHPLLKGTFTGEVYNNVLKGTFKKRKKAFEANFIKIVPQGLGAVSEISGYYQFAPGHIIEISPFSLDFSLTPITILDFKTGKKRVAFPTDSTTFQAGFKMLSPYPKDLSVNFTLGDAQNYSSVSYKDSEFKNSLKGVRLQDLTDTENITAKNGEVSLEGTITYPPTNDSTSSNFPLVILVPAGGNHSRENAFDDYIKLLPYMGVATLVYDKRGCGASTGDTNGSSFFDLSNDLLSIVREAKKNPNINKNKIGLLGIDQAGFIMPIAASKTKDIKFIINLSGAMMSQKEQEYIACEARMKADGFKQKEIKQALIYQGKMFDYLNGQLDSISFQKESDLMSTAKWKNYVTSFDKKEYIKWWRIHHNYSPVSYYSKLKIPVLSIYGEKDILVPPLKNEPVMKDLIMKNKSLNGKTMVLKGANHLLLLGEKRGDFQFSELEGYPNKLFKTINEWVSERVLKIN